MFNNPELYIKNGVIVILALIVVSVRAFVATSLVRFDPGDVASSSSSSPTSFSDFSVLRWWQPSSVPSSKRIHHISLRSLNTNLESMAEERANDESLLNEKERVWYKKLDWIKASSRTNGSPNCDDDNIDTMPLYPLDAVYVPFTNTTHILNNVQPRNIQMALDLMEQSPFSPPDKRFCVSLVASDTDRIARIGTIMEIDEMDPHIQGTDFRRIVIQCRPVGLGIVREIISAPTKFAGDVASESPDYLKAEVICVSGNSQLTNNEERKKQLVLDLLLEYDKVREYYVDMDIGTRHLPPFAARGIRDEWEEWSTSTPESFDVWTAADSWQRLCNTVREGHQSRLVAERNEFMVEAASKKPGPLNLPVRIHHLEREEQAHVRLLEKLAQHDFCKTGMDPCLDFQVLISLEDEESRLDMLRCLVKRERIRLESLLD